MTQSPTYETITESTDAGVVTLALARPERRNAMNGVLVAELVDALERLDRDERVRAIVLHGEGGGFCAGSDLAHLSTLDPKGKGDFEADSGRAAGLIRELGTPVIAAVHGFAIGGGLTLAVACDLVVSTAAAKWSLPEVPIGLFPAWGLDAVERRVGEVRARRLAWGIDTLDGATATVWGLVDELDEEPLARATALAASLAALPAAQVAATKRYVIDAGRGDALARSLFDEAAASPEGTTTFARFAR